LIELNFGVVWTYYWDLYLLFKQLNNHCLVDGVIMFSGNFPKIEKKIQLIKHFSLKHKNIIDYIRIRI